jgi:hypothetical protein
MGCFWAEFGSVELAVPTTQTAPLTRALTTQTAPLTREPTLLHTMSGECGRFISQETAALRALGVVLGESSPRRVCGG